MGNSINGKEQVSYYQLQLSLFRWRADPNHNAHLPRVRFAKRQQHLQKHHFAQAVEQQLQQHLFLDMAALKQGPLEAGEVIVFEQFAARLEELQGALETGECLYVLMGLMDGYEHILGRYGRTHIELSSCFVTPEGEVRAWLSDNPASNDLREEVEEGQRMTLYSSEAGVVKRLLDLLRRLSSGGREFSDFWMDLRLFAKSNMLQNCNFSAVRKFVNRYLFTHCISLPSNLGKALRRAKVIRFQSIPSSEEMAPIERSNLATRGQLSTYTQLDFLQPPPSHVIKRSNSFTKTDPPHSHPCDTGCRTPKTQQKFSPLDSTFINSQILLSRGKENKKGQSFHKSRNELERPTKPSDLADTPDKQPLAFLRKRKREDTTGGKVSVKFHSRQPSVDQESTSMFISPALEQQTDFGVHYSYIPQTHPSPKEQQQKAESFYQPGSSSAGKLTSQLLCRQVSGLVSNKSLSICESMGTFQSIENSKVSGYQGVLNKMGRTAKMLNLPTGKRLATFFRNNNNDPHTQ